MINLDFTTKILILNGEIVSFSKFNDTLWAACVVKVIIKNFTPILRNNNVDGSITISTKDDKVFVSYKTNSPTAEVAMAQIVERKQTLKGTNKLFQNEVN